MRLELTTFRSLLVWIHYETDALPTALPRHIQPEVGYMKNVQQSIKFLIILNPTLSLLDVNGAVV